MSLDDTDLKKVASPNPLQGPESNEIVLTSTERRMFRELWDYPAYLGCLDLVNVVRTRAGRTPLPKPDFDKNFTYDVFAQDFNLAIVNFTGLVNLIV